MTGRTGARKEYAAKLGVAIKDARERAGKSQQAVADHFGLTRQSVGAWETGVSMPSGMQLRELAVLLNNATILGVSENSATYSAGSSAEPRAVHSVPLKKQITPINGGFWMDNENDDATVRGRVRYHAAQPQMYAFQVLGDELFPRIRNGEYVIIDPQRPVDAGDEVLVTLVDGRNAILQLISRKHGMLSFQRISIDQKPVSLPEAQVVSIHFLRSIAKQDDFLLEG